MKNPEPGVASLSGLYADYRSFDPIAQAAAGVFSLTGEADGRPLYPGTSIGDSGTGVQMAMALLAAYVQRLRTGEGQHIEISMQEAATYYIRTRAAYAGAWGTEAAPRTGNVLGLPPSDLYPCKPFGANDWIYIAATTAEHWDALCASTDNPDSSTPIPDRSPHARHPGIPETPITASPARNAGRPATQSGPASSNCATSASHGAAETRPVAGAPCARRS